MRSQFIAIYMLAGNLIGAGLGGIIIPWLAHSFYGGSNWAIGHAVATAAVLVCPASFAILMLARKQFSTSAVETRMAAA